jgi:hypothetical protein
MYVKAMHEKSREKNLVLLFLELKEDHETYHEADDGDDGDDGGIPVVRQELLQGGDGLVRQKDLTQGGEGARGVNLGRWRCDGYVHCLLYINVHYTTVYYQHYKIY